MPDKLIIWLITDAAEVVIAILLIAFGIMGLFVGVALLVSVFEGYLDYNSKSNCKRNRRKDL